MGGTIAEGSFGAHNVTHGVVDSASIQPHSNRPRQLLPDDPRYLAVVDKGFNKRFRASPDNVRLSYPAWWRLALLSSLVPHALGGLGVRRCE